MASPFTIKISIGVALGVGFVFVLSQLDFGGVDKKRETEIVLGHLLNSFATFRRHCGRMPPLDGWKTDLLNKGNCNSWQGPYIQESQLVDSWGREVIYREKGNSFQIGSFGRDGQPGGEDNDEDLFLAVP